jgi:hypothetical protein
MNRKGSVLVHVLITTIIVVVIATGMAQMLMLRYAATFRDQDGLSKKRQTEGTFGRVTSYWNTNGFCSSPGGGISCSGVTASCAACTCTITAIAPHTVNGTLSASGTYPACRLTINSSDMP